MAAELRDLRARISVETDVCLDVEAKRRGLDRSELVREILDKWSDELIHAAQLLNDRLTAEGISAASAGGRGNAQKLRRASHVGGEQ